ncbi:hypothetical protein LZD49_35065 [Dyadobacter sp. CY261]|uniref:hypothetical protein n=1 Tax=Dyadobacter sp. CY261 TaxID=2907203 RepID=UPI001F21C2AC|nr:hypothetical protein [Dyadobacter sp. CY261]MCF0075745.1 hypothetical protein [Dyadobacter sp. CY261]
MKDIPDVNMQAAIGIIGSQIQQLTESKLNEIVGYALKYPPRVRALLGAVLSSTGKAAIAKALKESLNPLTIFKLGINDTLLPLASEWNIQ